MDSFLASARFIALFGASYGLLLFIIAIGLVITFGLMRVANLAHGVFAAAGGYVCFVLANHWSLSFGWALLASVLIVSAASLVVEKLFFTYLYQSSELDQVVMTIGLCFICVASLSLAFGPNVLPIKLPALLSANVNALGAPFPAYRLFVLALGAVIVTALWFLLDRTTYGAKLRAAVDNRSMAQATGLNVDRLFSSAFALGAALAALGGAVGAAMLPLDPMYPFKYLPLFLTVVALAGMGNIKTSLPVAVLVGIIDTAGRYLVPQYGAFTVYLLLIGLMLWRPNGLLTAGREAA